jgi:hypothetical protein
MRNLTCKLYAKLRTSALLSLLRITANSDMAPLVTSQIARAVATDNDDPFDIKNVSGFYGLGS